MKSVLVAFCDIYVRMAACARLKRWFRSQSVFRRHLAWQGLLSGRMVELGKRCKKGAATLRNGSRASHQSKRWSGQLNGSTRNPPISSKDNLKLGSQAGHRYVAKLDPHCLLPAAAIVRSLIGTTVAMTHTLKGVVTYPVACTVQGRSRSASASTQIGFLGQMISRASKQWLSPIACLLKDCVSMASVRRQEIASAHDCGCAWRMSPCLWVGQTQRWPLSSKFMTHWALLGGTYSASACGVWLWVKQPRPATASDGGPFQSSVLAASCKYALNTQKSGSRRESDGCDVWV